MSQWSIVYSDLEIAISELCDLVKSVFIKSVLPKVYFQKCYFQKCIFRNVIFKSVYDWVTSADRGACGTFVCTFSPGGSISDLKTAISAARVVKCRNLSSHFNSIGFYKLGVLSDQSVFVILLLHLRIQNQVIKSNRSSSVYHAAPPEMQQYFHAAQSHNVVTNPAWAFSRPNVALFQSFWCCMGT